MNNLVSTHNSTITQSYVMQCISDFSANLDNEVQIIQFHYCTTFGIGLYRCCLQISLHQVWIILCLVSNFMYIQFCWSSTGHQRKALQ